MLKSGAGTTKLASHQHPFHKMPAPDQRYQERPMSTLTPPPSPWQPAHEREPRFVLAEPVYKALLQTLHTASRINPDLPTAAAVMASIDLGYDLAVMSGLLWESPDLIAALRKLADTLEARRDSEPPRPVLATVRECFAASRPSTSAQAPAN
jgi:hypothetical protein